MSANQKLPPRELALYERLNLNYENRQYKGALKLAKQILSNPKCSNHGETLSMKGLILNEMGRRAEAWKYVHLGLRNNLCSHVCWHAYGILQRMEKKYEEAMKCYRNSLKWNKQNVYVLKDLSWLQIQTRDCEGFKETRHQMFALAPSKFTSWMGLAVGYHLIGDLGSTYDILETFLQSETVNARYRYEHSELRMYQAQILIEARQWPRAVAHLQQFEADILDKLALLETLGHLYIVMDKYDEAAVVFEQLIKRNQENKNYYELYFTAKQFLEREQQFGELKKLQLLYPRAQNPRRLALNVCEGSVFRNELDVYLRRGLRKGSISLFKCVRGLYQNAAKKDIIEALLLTYCDNLKRTGHFSHEDAAQNLAVEPATALMWTLLFLAQHYDSLADVEQALEYINAAIEHTPTLPESLIVKGRIYKHAGDLEAACDCLNEAQSMDTADRYINSKCCKYLLRANKVAEAEAMCAKYLGTGEQTMDQLNDKQCLWYLLECALAYQRMERWGEALKLCHEIDRQFCIILDNQYEYHAYSLRVVRMRAYVDLLRQEDVLFENPYFFKAAKCAIEIYMRLDDKLAKQEETKVEEQKETEQQVPNAEERKLRRKLEKAKKKAESAQQAQAKAQAQPQKFQHQQAEFDAARLEEQLIPEQLEATKQPVVEAYEFLLPLQEFGRNNLETHLLAFEVFMRKQKILLMVQAVKRARRIDPENSEVHCLIIRFVKMLEVIEPLVTFNEHVRIVVDRALEEFLGGKSARQLIDEFIEKHSNSIAYLVDGVLSSKIMGDNETKTLEAINMLTSFDATKVDLETASHIYTLLRDGVFGDYESITANYRDACRKRFKFARLFHETSEEQEEEPQLKYEQNEEKQETNEDITESNTTKVSSELTGQSFSADLA